MKNTLRAALAVGLLVGFYLIALAMVIAVVALAILLMRWGGGVPVGFLIFAVVVVAALGRSLVPGPKEEPSERDGLVLSETDQPTLWREVRKLADFAATRPPDEIRLVASANAAVAEDTSMLGLIGGKRTMLIGAPLLVGLSREQLRAVLAHELGHYSGRHTAFGALTYRGQEAIGRALSELDDNLARIPLLLYSRLYLAVAQSVNRRQELEADRLSAALVGANTAAEALRAVVALGPGWTHFLQQYVAPGADVGGRPRDLFDGFRQFVTEPGRQSQLADLRANPQEPPPSVYDTHPPITKRLAAFGSTTASDSQDTSGPATTLLADPQADLARLGESVFAESEFVPMDFDELMDLAARAETSRNARVFLNAVDEQGISCPTLGGLLTALKEKRSQQLLELVRDNDDQEEVHGIIATALAYTVAHSLIEQGCARYALDWSGSPRLVDSVGESLDPYAPAYEALAADGDGVAAFEAWLDAHGVRLDVEVPPFERAQVEAPDEPTRWLGALAPVKTSRFSRHRVLGVADSGVVIYRPPYGDRRAASLSTQSFRNGGRVYTNRLLARQPAEALSNGKSQHFRWADIASLAARNDRFSRRAQLTAGDGSVVNLRWSTTAHSEGELWPVISYFLGERFTVENPPR